MVWSPYDKLSTEEVAWLFRSILGRDPDEGAIRTFLDRHPHFASVRNDLLHSTEFYLMIKDRLSDFRTTYCACDYPAAVAKIPSRNSVCLLSIVKNEENHIGRMIQSCLPIVKSILVVDTGSTDNTIQVAKKCAGDVPIEIKSIEFVDFAQARNYGLKSALGRSDWILALDADEYLVREDLPNLAYMIDLENDVDGWRLPRYNFLQKTFPSSLYLYPDYQRRLFRNRNTMRYVGAVHELLEGVNRWGFAPMSEIAQGGSCGGPHIHHLGLIDSEKMTKKFEFYKSLGHIQ